MNLFRTILEFVVKDRASGAVDGLSKNLDKATESATNAQKSFKNLAGAFVALVVAGRVKAMFQSVLDPARKMEASIQRLGYISGATGEQLESLKRTAQDVAKVTVFGPLEATDAMVQLVRATGSASDAEKMLGVTAGLAQASFGKMTLAKSTTMVTDMAKAFSLTGEETEAAANRVLKATQTAGVGVEEMGSIMGYLGTAALRGGQSLDTLLQSFVLARRVLPSSKRAATEILRAMGELSSTKTMEAMAKVGVQTTDLEGNVRDFSSVMLDMAKVAAVAPLDLRDAMNEAFGEGAGKPMLAILSQLSKGMRTMTGETVYGADVFKYLGEQINDSTGAVDKASEAYMKTADAGIRRLDEAWTTFKTTVGEQLLPSLGYLAKGLSDLLSWVVQLANTSPYLMKVVKAFMFMGGAVLAVSAMRMALTGFYMIVQGARAVVSSFAQSLVGATAAQTANSAATTAGAASTGFFGRMLTAARASMAATSATTTAFILKAKALGFAWGTLGLEMAGFNLRMKAAAVGMALFPRLATGVIWSLRGIGLAVRGLAMAVKSLISATGIGLLIAFLPEIIEGLSKLKKYLDDNATGMIRWAEETKKGGGVLGWFVKQFEKMLPFNFQEFLKIEALSRNLETYKQLLEEKRLAQQRASYERMHNLMVFATKPFDEAVDKLEKLFGYKPSLIKASDILLMKNELNKVLAAGAGGAMTTTTGERIGITERDVGAAKAGLAGIDQATRLMREAQEQGRSLTGKEFTAVATGLYRGHAGVRETQPASADLLARTAAPGMAALQQAKEPSRNAEAMLRMLVGDRNVHTGVADRTMSPWSDAGQRYIRRHEGGYNTLAGELGGAEGQGAYAQKLGRGRTGLGGAATQGGDERMLWEIEGEKKKNAGQQLEELNAKISKIEASISRIAREGVKVEDAGDPKAKERSALRKAYGLNG